jgi:hypothetical protein
VMRRWRRTLLKEVGKPRRRTLRREGNSGFVPGCADYASDLIDKLNTATSMPDAGAAIGLRRIG